VNISGLNENQGWRNDNQSHFNKSILTSPTKPVFAQQNTVWKKAQGKRIGYWFHAVSNTAQIHLAVTETKGF
jgi:hypothetical protein